MKISENTVAVITGGASGIGLGLAEAVAARGGRVVISDVREAALAPALDRLRIYGGECRAELVDVSDSHAVERLAHNTLETYGRVDLVCNNAGLVSPAAPTWEQTPETWARMIAVKITGVVNGIRAFVPHLVKQGTGHVLNTASSGGLAPLPSRSPYSTTMHAVVGLTETLDVELKAVSDRLGATVLCPGLVDTPLGANSAALGAIELPPDAPVDMRSFAPDILSPRDVAEAALLAVERGSVLVAPGRGVAERARARIDRVLHELADVS